MSISRPIPERRPSAVHLLLQLILDAWSARISQTGEELNVQKNNPLLFKPIAFLCLDELRRGGFPICIDAEFRDPVAHLSTDLLESRTLSRALSQSIAMGWIGTPIAGWPNYRLTVEGQHLISAEAAQLADLEAMQQVSRWSSDRSSAGLPPVTAGDELHGIVNSTVSRVGGIGPAELRSILITQAMKILLEPHLPPMYDFHDSYMHAVDPDGAPNTGRFDVSSSPELLSRIGLHPRR